MLSFRIAYKPYRGSDYVARIIDANTVGDAIRKIGDYHSIRSVSVKCSGNRVDGGSCGRFSINDFCSAHVGVN